MGREREKTLKIKNFYGIFFYFHEVLLMVEGEGERKRQIGERERMNEWRMGGQAVDG